MKLSLGGNASSSRALLLTVALCFVIAGCGGGMTNLPTHHDWGQTLPAALLTGRLSLSGNCVWLDADQRQGRLLVVWPPGTSRDGNSIDSGGKEIANVGDQVSLQGAAYDSAEIGPQIESPVPPGCTTDAYWGVAAVLSAAPAASP